MDGFLDDARFLWIIVGGAAFSVPLGAVTFVLLRKELESVSAEYSEKYRAFLAGRSLPLFRISLWVFPVIWVLLLPLFYLAEIQVAFLPFVLLGVLLYVGIWEIYLLRRWLLANLSEDHTG